MNTIKKRIVIELVVMLGILILLCVIGCAGCSEASAETVPVNTVPAGVINEAAVVSEPQNIDTIVVEAPALDADTAVAAETVKENEVTDAPESTPIPETIPDAKLEAPALKC